MATRESFAERIQRLRVARGLSECDLAARVGMTVRQFRAVTDLGTKLTCSLLNDVAEAIDVSFADLTDLTDRTSPTSEELLACLRCLRERRAALARRMANDVTRVHQQLVRLRGLLDIDATPSGDDFEPMWGLMGAIERNEPLRACATRYVWLIVQRCAGNRRQACQVLGISYHTLRAYLGSAERT